MRRAVADFDNNVQTVKYPIFSGFEAWKCYDLDWVNISLVGLLSKQNLSIKCASYGVSRFWVYLKP